MAVDPGDPSDEADGPDDGPEDAAFGDQETSPERTFETSTPERTSGADAPAGPAPAPEPGPTPVEDATAPRYPVEP